MAGFFGGLDEALTSGSERDLRRAQLQQAAQQQTGQSAAGGAMSALFGGDVPGATPMPSGPQTGLQRIGSGIQNLISHLGGQPQQQAGAGGQPQQPPFAPGVGQAPQQGSQGQPGGPLTVQGNGGQQPSQGSLQGKLDWKQIVGAIKQKNPGIDNASLMQAVTQFMPIMNQQSQQEWRQLSLGLRQQQIEQQGNLGNRRADISEGNLGERKTHDRALEGQADERLGQGDRRLDQGDTRLGQQKQEWTANQQRLKDNFNQRGQVIMQKLQAAKTKDEAAMSFRELEALKKEAHQAQVTQIQAANSVLLPDEDKSRLIADARKQEADATAQIDQMKQQTLNRLQTGGAALGGDGQFSSNMQPKVPGKRDMVIALRKQGEEKNQAAGSNAPGQVGGHGASGGNNAALDAARAAIAKGAPRDAVLQRLKSRGIDATGL